MKNTFKRIVFLTMISLANADTPCAKTVDGQLHEMRTKIERLHDGFGLIFFNGDPKGHDDLSKLEAIQPNEGNSEAGKKLNALVKKLNAIFKTIRHIVTKYRGKGRHASVNFLFEIGKSCNLEELFKETISELEAVLRLVESVNDNSADRAILEAFIDFVKKIQPIWHDALSQKDVIVSNLRNSLEKASSRSE